MDNLDETILNLRNEQQKEGNPNIQSGVYIKGVWTEFVETEILSKKFTLLIPKSFVDMPSAIAKVKYPGEQRPQCIKTSLDTTVNMAVSFFGFPVNEKQIEQEAAQLKMVLKKTNPAMEFYQSNTEELKDFKLAWFDYKSFAIDHQMYNIMFIAAAEGKMLHGVFNCMYEDYKEWFNPAVQMIQSIRFANGDE
jgi:hypothetical protein